MADVPQITDQVSAELEKAKLRAKQERHATIGNLLDQATEVLSDILDSTDGSLTNQRMRAAEIAVNLYIQQENGDRQDRTLDLQQKRLDVEIAKLSQPGQPLFQQNNVYVQGGEASVNPVASTQEQQDQLYARKKAQDALLATYLPKKEPSEAVLLPEDTTGEDT